MSAVKQGRDFPPNKATVHTAIHVYYYVFRPMLRLSSNIPIQIQKGRLLIVKGTLVYICIGITDDGLSMGRNM